MAFSANTYSELSAGVKLLDDLLNDLNNRISAAIAEPSSIVSEVSVFGTHWGTIQGLVDAALAADPTNLSLQYMSSHVAKLVADFGAISAKATALETAVGSI